MNTQKMKLDQIKLIQLVWISERRDIQEVSIQFINISDVQSGVIFLAMETHLSHSAPRHLYHALIGLICPQYSRSRRLNESQSC